MISRRRFLKTASLAGGAAVLNLPGAWSKPPQAGYYGLHDFVESHPDAVFILRTAIDAKTNTAALKGVGYQLGRSLFVPKPDSTNAYPVNTNLVLKPNITSWAWDKAPIEQTMGIQTDPFFVEGIVAGFVDLSVPIQNVYVREANYSSGAADGAWYLGLAQRTGLDLKSFPTLSQMAPADIQWVNVPDGVWYNRIPYLWPVNSPGSCLLNIAKFKSHSMGMTLCSKNVQGTNARPYVAHCNAWGATMAGVDPSHIQPNAFDTIKSNYDRHKTTIPRWKTLDGDPGGASNGGLRMETHTSRCLDNNSVLRPLLNIIEGVYGREGPFVSGPSASGYGIDVMSNIVIFGKNARHVDVVGTFLAGHEPGNFGLFHIAVERGLSKYLNPRDVPLYEWKLDGTATVASLENFARTPIRTLYLQQPGEQTYHMVDQAFDYSGVTTVRTEQRKPDVPDAFAVSQNFPNPFNPSTSIQYYLPKGGDVRIEILDVQGQVVDVLVDAYISAGDHLTVWHADHRASGTYFYRLFFGGFAKTKSMVLIR
jgi:hypothetical protein